MSDKTTDAILGSVDAILRVRAMRAEAKIRPASAAVEHMPFAGHRTVATVWKQQATAQRGHRIAMQYGFDPASLEASLR